MNAQTAPPGRRFQARIYRDLDRRLKASPWNSGASEAHGLLSALACLGVPAERLPTKARLFQLSEAADVGLLEGMYGLILRDLQCDGFAFDLLLADGAADDGEPDNESSAANEIDEIDEARRLESVADWCGGFIQGFFHDGAGGKNPLDGISGTARDTVRESVDDILEISRVEVNLDARTAGEETQKQLVEIEQYLRVAVQVIFEELNADAPSPAAGTTGVN